MPDSLLVQLQPHQIEVEPGGTPVEAVLALQNLGRVVEQYTTEVSGLDADWFTAPVASVGLFPQDREQLRISFHPPRRPGLKAGTYPFRILVRARGGAEQETVEGVLDVRGFAVYRLDVTPRRLTGRRSGNYRVQLSNTGTADARLSLEGRDEQDALRFKFGHGGSALIAAGSKTELSLNVRPKRRPWLGPERTYGFKISAKPQDARGEVQTVEAEYTHRPLFTSWKPVRRVMGFVVLLLFIGFVITILSSVGVFGELPRRMAIAGAQVKTAACRVPVLDRLCPADVVVAKPEPAAPEACKFEYGFKDFADAEPKMVGNCTSYVAYDGFGNGLQWTEYGVLFWLKASNTVYYFVGDRVYAQVDNQTKLVDAPGRPLPPATTATVGPAAPAVISP